MSRSDRPPSAPEPDDPPSEEEQRAAEQLRRTLQRGAPDRPGEKDWELIEAVRSAASPATISESRLRQIVDRAVDQRPKRGKIVYLAVGGVASLVAMAAAVALLIVNPETVQRAPGAAPPAMAISRSTATLFPEGIPLSGGTSDRVDRIAYARAQDLRQNQFARWGAR